MNLYGSCSGFIETATGFHEVRQMRVVISDFIFTGAIEYVTTCDPILRSSPAPNCNKVLRQLFDVGTILNGFT